MVRAQPGSKPSFLRRPPIRISRRYRRWLIIHLKIDSLEFPPWVSNARLIDHGIHMGLVFQCDSHEEWDDNSPRLASHDFLVVCQLPYGPQDLRGIWTGTSVIQLLQMLISRRHQSQMPTHYMMVRGRAAAIRMYYSYVYRHSSLVSMRMQFIYVFRITPDSRLTWLERDEESDRHFVTRGAETIVISAPRSPLNSIHNLDEALYDEEITLIPGTGSPPRNVSDDE